MNAQILSASEASRLLNVPIGRVLRSIKATGRPVVRLGRAIAIDQKELLRLDREFNPAAVNSPKTGL